MSSALHANYKIRLLRETVNEMKRARDTDAHGTAQWYDFFCGGGLAAHGARAAGFAVAQGVDNDAVALAEEQTK